MEQFGLQRDGHLPDLVEEDGAPVGSLEPALLAAISPRERATLVSEQLALQEIARHRGAVDLHEGALASRRHAVQAVGHHLLADPCLPKNQDGDVGGPDQAHMRRTPDIGSNRHEGQPRPRDASPSSAAARSDGRISWLIAPVPGCEAAPAMDEVDEPHRPTKTSLLDTRVWPAGTGGMKGRHLLGPVRIGNVHHAQAWANQATGISVLRTSSARLMATGERRLGRAIHPGHLEGREGDGPGLGGDVHQPQKGGRRRL